MRDLNKARVTFKHYGIVPADAATSKLQTYAEQFLVGACNEFFGVDFKTLSLIDFIANDQVAQHLRLAKKAVDENDAKESLEQCAFAHRLLVDIINGVLPPIAPSGIVRMHSETSSVGSAPMMLAPVPSPLWPGPPAPSRTPARMDRV